jgi:hypothetical protein
MYALSAVKHGAYLLMMFDEYKAPVLINTKFQHQMLAIIYPGVNIYAAIVSFTSVYFMRGRNYRALPDN